MKDHEFFVYIVSSRSGTLYIGLTNSIYRRALQHKREGPLSPLLCHPERSEGPLTRMRQDGLQGEFLQCHPIARSKLPAAQSKRSDFSLSS